ncbi:hypothetical protein AAVH_23636 [Aphelenchoides avenae]|nr:hypothetical protein AAVH_23636 [Aphelenchus avenae]
MTVPTACYFCYYDQMKRSETDPSLFEALPCTFNAQVAVFSTVNITFRDAFPVIVASVAVSYNYSVVLFCSIGVWRKMQGAPLYVSPKLQSMNRQLGRMLVAQAIAPILLVGAPLTAMFVVIYEKMVDAPSLMLVTSMLSWITLVNPLSTIYFVKAYRYKLVALITRRSRIEPFGTSHNDTAIYGTYVDGGKQCFELGLLCTTQACDYRCKAYGFGTAGGCNKAGYGCCCFNKTTTKAPTATLPPKPTTYQLKCFEAGLLCTDVYCQKKCKEYGYGNEGDCNRGGYGCCCGKGAKPKRKSPV